MTGKLTPNSRGSMSGGFGKRSMQATDASGAGCDCVHELVFWHCPATYANRSDCDCACDGSRRIDSTRPHRSTLIMRDDPSSRHVVILMDPETFIRRELAR